MCPKIAMNENQQYLYMTTGKVRAPVENENEEKTWAEQHARRITLKSEENFSLATAPCMIT